jgi:hypothetical protein
LLFSRNMFAFIIILSLLPASIVLSGCGGNGSPRATMDEYVKSIQGKNYKKAWNLLSDKNRGARSDEEELSGFRRFKDDWEKSMKDAALKEQISSTRVVKEDVHGDRATVTIQFNKEACSWGKEPAAKKEVTQDLQLVKEKGKWKVSI